MSNRVLQRRTISVRNASLIVFLCCFWGALFAHTRPFLFSVLFALGIYLWMWVVDYLKERS